MKRTWIGTVPALGLALLAAGAAFAACNPFVIADCPELKCGGGLGDDDGDGCFDRCAAPSCPAIDISCAPGSRPGDTDGDGCVDACVPVECPAIGILCDEGEGPGDTDGDGCDDGCVPSCTFGACPPNSV